jgi:hypothetical protein
MRTAGESLQNPRAFLLSVGIVAVDDCRLCINKSILGRFMGYPTIGIHHPLLTMGCTILSMTDEGIPPALLHRPDQRLWTMYGLPRYLEISIVIRRHNLAYSTDEPAQGEAAPLRDLFRSFTSDKSATEPPPS